MTRVPLPADVTAIIADRAVSAARRDVVKRGWKSASAIRPTSGPGRAGVSSTVNHLLIQNRGFDPFVMWWVKNRVVPLGCPQGDGPHHRNGAGVGTPGMVDIPHRGKVFRPVRWRHPGLKPKRFLESAVGGAVRGSRAEVRDVLARSLRGGR